MSLVCVTYSHRHVPIAFREKVYFDSNAMANACARFRCGSEKPSSIIELSILSTCNRTEIYAFYRANGKLGQLDDSRNEIVNFIGTACEVDEKQLFDFGEWFDGPDVVNHLSRVACGLESLVLGEPQVLGQVGDAMRLGLIMNSAGPVLTNLFQTAIRAGRRARTETHINNHSLNISTVAVNTAEKKLGNLCGKTVLVLGAGEMADLAISQLRKKGATDIRVVNRTLAKASELATKHQGKAYVFEHLTSLLSAADVLITSTGAPHTLITKEMIASAMQDRVERPMMILDIAVPRDVDMAVEDIPNVERCDVDDLHMTTGNSLKMRKEEIPSVEEIISIELENYLEWFRSIGIESTVASLRQKAEQIRSNELTRLGKLLPELDEDSWQVVQKFSESLVNKLLHDPTIQLREVQGTRAAIDHGEAIRQLFRLHLAEEHALDRSN